MSGASTGKGGTLCLTGGVGGAKLVLGLYRALPPEELVVAINTGDDFTHWGLEIWPDFDTTLYVLSGLSDYVRGWGRVDETWECLKAMGALGGETWFQLGDRDLSTHITRTNALRAGLTPGEVGQRLAAALGIETQLVPAAETPIRTIVETPDGDLAFQDYFVRLRAEPRVTGLRYEGVGEARPSAPLAEALADPDLRGVILAPSNPLLSTPPVLEIAGVRAALAGLKAPVVAVTPIIGGAAVKGPSAKIMAELGLEVTPVAVARLYRDFLDGFVIDETDAHMADEVRALGLECHVAQTLMRTEDDKIALARETLAFVDRLAG
ncbi:MAG: 2-phospho-L-lactate transferase [Caulobacteraceae bacterium]|nr:2-phospho-L-lactate transferase [Caulobacteraceae bacterium]